MILDFIWWVRPPRGGNVSLTARYYMCAGHCLFILIRAPANNVASAKRGEDPRQILIYPPLFVYSFMEIRLPAFYSFILSVLSSTSHQ